MQNDSILWFHSNMCRANNMLFFLDSKPASRYMRKIEFNIGLRYRSWKCKLEDKLIMSQTRLLSYRYYPLTRGFGLLRLHHRPITGYFPCLLLEKNVLFILTFLLHPSLFTINFDWWPTPTSFGECRFAT